MAAVPGRQARIPSAPDATRVARITGTSRTARLKVWLIVGLVIVLGLFVPSVLKSNFYLGLVINAMVLGIAAVSIGFLAHQCGLVMFGAAGFTGGATYLCGIAVTQFGWNVMAATAFCLVARWPNICRLSRR